MNLVPRLPSPIQKYKASSSYSLFILSTHFTAVRPYNPKQNKLLLNIINNALFHHGCCNSKCTIFPSQKTSLSDLKLSVSDLPMLSTHYIQKGALFARPHFSVSDLLSLLKRSLSQTLTHFPPLAGRLITDSDGYVYISCNDAGADFIHATAAHIFVRDVIGSIDVPDRVKELFTFDRTVSYQGHFKPLLAVQVTELADGVFISCSVNHAVIDGTSL